MLSPDGMELLRRNKDIAGWIYTPLLLGAYDRDDRPLSREYEHPGNTRRIEALNDVASKRGLSRSQIVLAWLTGGDPHLTPMVGVSSVSQVEQAWFGASTELTDEERAQLDAAF
jgi:aryl-alcohol dehydrogenase-like predicted oxidoreductase